MPGHKEPVKVLVIAMIPDDLRKALSAEFEVLDHILEAGAPPADRPISDDCEIVVTRAVYGYPAAAADLFPNARLLLSFGAGLEQIDLGDLQRRNIKLIHTPDELTEDVADYAIGLAYAARRRIAEGDRFVRAGRWTKGRFGLSLNLSRARAGILGMGRIGQRIAEKANALGMSISYTDREQFADLPYSFEPSVADLAAASDIFFVACAGTPETEKIVNASVLDALGPDGILINTSRGSIVDEDALIAALETGRLGGAALDVFEQEPAIDPRFNQLENVVLSPHAASFTYDAREAMVARLVTGARDYAAAR